MLTQRRFPTWLDDQHREARILGILEAEEAKLPDERARRRFERAADAWTSEYTRILVEHLIAELAQASLLSGEPASDEAMLEQAVRQALSLQDLLDTSGPSSPGLRGQRLIACARKANDRTRAETRQAEGFAVSRYADELQLVHTVGGAVTLRPAGEVFLGLRGRDTMRWLLALEVSAALGEGDRWRIGANRAKGLAKDGYAQFDDGDPAPWPWNYPTQRFEWEGLLKIKPYGDDSGIAFWRCRVTPIGAELFGELDQTSGEALRSLARSILADEAHVALHGRPPLVSQVSGLSRHTKMVAHELRNALVPVQFALKQLRRQLKVDDSAPESIGSLDTMAAGIERALRFVVETARITSQGAASEELFGALAAVRDAIETVQPESRHPVALDAPSEVELVYLRGWRDHFVLALLNLLRNAIQVGGETVRIFITCQTSSRGLGRRLTILVEDDGPGVPPEKQGEIFADGVSLRAGGTGRGLAFVREVIEDEFKGSVHHERSPHGGARFVLVLPIPLEGQS